MTVARRSMPTFIVELS